MSKQACILVLDDDAAFRGRLGEALSARGHTVKLCGSLIEARAELDTPKLTHAIVDLRLSGESGLELVQELSSRGVKVVMLTGYGSVATALEAVRLGTSNYLSKPASIAAIEQALFGSPLTPAGENLNDSVPTLDQVEWEHIQRVLRDCQGNVTHAAKRLGLHRQALQRKLRTGPER